MADECYMLMYKWGKKSLTHKLLKAPPPKVFAPMMAASSDMIFGDCFEMLPFVLPPKGWIKVDAFSHSMSALSSPEDDNYARKLQAYHRAVQTRDTSIEKTVGAQWVNSRTRDEAVLRKVRRNTVRRGVATYDEYKVKGAKSLKTTPGDATENTFDSGKGGMQKLRDKEYAQGGRHRTINSKFYGKTDIGKLTGDKRKWYQLGGDKLPSHGNFSITKRIDRATPQIAYCCASAMKLRFAWIFLRKKTGPGLPQIRIPHCMIRLEKCIVTDHQLTDANEIFQLSYKKISWYYVDSLTNTGVPTGWFNYSWDTEENKGNKD